MRNAMTSQNGYSNSVNASLSTVNCITNYGKSSSALFRSGLVAMYSMFRDVIILHATEVCLCQNIPQSVKNSLGYSQCFFQTPLWGLVSLWSKSALPKPRENFKFNYRL